MTVRAPPPTHPLLALPLAATGPLEQAAAAIARLELALAGHGLRPAFAYWSRLEAIRRHTFADGFAIDPWQLAALHLDLHLCLAKGQTPHERGVLFAAARHALALETWFAAPDARQSAAIQRASAHLERAGGFASPLVGAGLAAQAWLAEKKDVAALRAALASYWPRRGLTGEPLPLLTGCGALLSAGPPVIETFLPNFFAALAEEADAGFALFRLMDAEWRRARTAVAKRRRDSRAAAALDLVAASPLVSAKALAGTLGMAVNNATHLLEGLVGETLIVEVTGRHKRRLYGLPHVAGLRQAIARPRLPVPGRGRGRPPRVSGADEERNGVRPEPPADHSFPVAFKILDAPRHLESLPPPDFDFSELDRFLHQAEAASTRSRDLIGILQKGDRRGPRAGGESDEIDSP